MNDATKKNLPLYIGLTIPVLMVIAIIMAIYIPRLSAPRPKYNFIYTTSNGYYQDYNFQVNNKHLVKTPVTAPYPAPKPTNSMDPTLYEYDVHTNTSKEISFPDAQKLTLDASGQSLDGFEISQGSYGGDFLFGGGSRDYNAHYITGHGISKKLNLRIPANNGYYNFQFLGWVE